MSAHESHRLLDYFEGRLSGSERLEVQRHLAACPDCQRELAQLHAVLRSLVEIPRTIRPDERTRASRWHAVWSRATQPRALHNALPNSLSMGSSMAMIALLLIANLLFRSDWASGLLTTRPRLANHAPETVALRTTLRAEQDTTAIPGALPERRHVTPVPNPMPMTSTTAPH